MNKPLICLGCAVMSVGIAMGAPSKLSPPDASWDNRISPSFPGVDGEVRATTVFDGELVVAGRFTIAGQTEARSIAAWNGSSWSALGSGLRSDDGGADVRDLAVFDGKLIAAGQFRIAGEAPANGIAAWDGNAWSPLGSGFPYGEVYALAVFDGRLIAAGAFGIAGDTFASAVASWDGVSWSALGPGIWLYTDDAVFALAVVDGRLIAGGRFSYAGGWFVHNIASWDGSSWSRLGEGRSSPVKTLAVYEDHLVAGGSVFASWDGSTWTTLGHDDPQSTGALIVYGNRLIASTRSGDSYLASWDGTAWTDVVGGPNYYVTAFTIYEDRLIAGGGFGAAGAVPARGIASWDGASWSGIYGAAPGVAGRVRDLTVFRGKLIAGGEFTSAGDVAGGIAAWDGTAWSALGSGIGHGVTSLTVFDGRLVAGGWFTEAGGVPAAHLAAWNGRAWAAIGSGIPPPSAMTSYDHHLIVGNDEAFDCTDPVGPFGCGGYAWATSWDGVAWSPLGSTLDGVYGSFTTYDDQLIMLTAFGGVRAWNGGEWSPLGGTGVAVSGATNHDGSLLVGLSGLTCGWLGCSLVPEIDAWDGSSWSSFETDLDGQVWALTVYDGQVIAGGDFTTIGGVAANHIAAWDGERWSPLGSGTDGPVRRLVVYEGSLIVAGDFRRAGGKLSQSIAVWRKPPGAVRRGSMGSQLPATAATPRGRAQLLGSAGP